MPVIGAGTRLARPTLRRTPRPVWRRVVFVAVSGSGRKPMLHAGSVVGIIVRLVDARAAGTAEFEVTINDNKTGLVATIDAGDPQIASATQAEGLDPFSAGAVLGVVMTTVGFSPDTVPLVFVEVVEDLT